MLSQLQTILPTDSISASGHSKEDEVQQRLNDKLIPMLPPDFVESEYIQKLKIMDGPEGLGQPGKMDVLPLNMFLRQEIGRF